MQSFFGIGGLYRKNDKNKKWPQRKKNGRN